jgi:hypothetical protein
MRALANMSLAILRVVAAPSNCALDIGVHQIPSVIAVLGRRRHCPAQAGRQRLDAVNNRLIKVSDAQKKRTAALAAKLQGLTRASPGHLDSCPCGLFLEIRRWISTKLVPMQIPALVIDSFID